MFRKPARTETVDEVIYDAEGKYVEPAYITEARKRAKEYLGTKWVLHPDNAAVKKAAKPNTLGRK